ncbi:MAG: ATP-binding protein [Cytophagales bacterium]
MKLPINTSIMLKVLFVTSISLIFFIGGVTYKKLNDISKSSNLVLHTYDVSLNLENLISELSNYELIERDYLLLGDNASKKLILLNRQKLYNQVSDLKKMISDNSSQVNKIEKINQILNQKFLLSDSIYFTTQTNETINKNHLTKQLLRGLRINIQFKQIIRDMIAHEKQLLSHRTHKAKYDLLSAPLILYSVLIFTLFFIVLAYFKISKDLNNQKQLNNTLEITNEIITLGENVGKYGNWQWNITDNSLYFSDSLYSLLGSEPGAFAPTAENYIERIHPEDRERVALATENLFQNFTFPDITYRLLLPQNEIKYIRAGGKLVTNKSGEKVFVGCSSDITEEYLRLVELENRYAELESKNKELEEFNFVASHDLQEPLRKIQTFISRIEASDDYEQFSENNKNYFSRVSNAATRMRKLIDDLLQYSRSSKSELVFENYDLNLILDAALKELTPILEEVKPIFEKEELPTLQVVPYQIQQVFLNLIGNSLKYKSVSEECKIVIKYSLTEFNSILNDNLTAKKYHLIEISDNGIGFEQQYADKIFNLFSRLHSKDQYSGTGIGLAICKKIIENHRGFMEAQGTPNVGATFKIYLPA